MCVVNTLTSPKGKALRSQIAILNKGRDHAGRKAGALVSAMDLRSKIHTIRGMQVMLDNDLAVLYGVKIKRLNEQVKRNKERFPESFCFQLSSEEAEVLRSQFATLKDGQGLHRKYLPYVFTEQGVAMLSAVLRSKTAVKVSIQIIRAFVEMRRFLQANAWVFQRVETVEKRQFIFEAETEKKFEKVFDALDRSGEDPKHGIFFDGQVHDAHTFVSGLIRGAKKSIVLVDNYVDDTVLTLLGKRAKGVGAVIFTKSFSKALALDVKKHNEQYSPVEIKEFAEAHDRFLILDERVIFHFGASLKDLGKKWFAFSKFEKGAVQMLEKLGCGK